MSASTFGFVSTCTRVALASTLTMGAPYFCQELVADINQLPGNSSSAFPSNFLSFGGQAYFAADVPGMGRELVVTDGVSTLPFFDVDPGGAGSPRNLVQLDATVFVFTAKQSVTGRELWRSDGTEAGTFLVADVQPGPLGLDDASDFFQPVFVEHSGRVYFTANDGTNGVELWSTDGLTARLELDLTPGAAGTGFVEMVSSGSLLFFTTAPDGELYSYDGTSAVLLHGLGYSLLDFGGTLFFAGESPLGIELFSTDGTLAGTTLFFDAYPGPSSSGPRLLLEHGGEAYFVAGNSFFSNILFKTDGTSAGTIPIAVLPGPASLQSRAAVSLGDDFVFVVDAFGRDELWSSDGTVVGTGPISTFAPATYGIDMSSLVVIDELAYLMVFVKDLGWNQGSLGRELWVTDGESLELVVDLHPGNEDGISPNAQFSGLAYVAAPVGNELVFGGNDSGGEELWKTDGTAAGTMLLADLDPPGSNIGSTPRDFVRFGTRVLFTADDHFHGRELWSSDGTEEGTQMVADVYPGFHESDPELCLEWGDLYFFSAWGAEGREPWVTDGTTAGTLLLADIHPVIWSSNPEWFTPLGDRVLFSASNTTVGIQLWSTDGTPAGTEQVTSTIGAVGLNPTELVEFQGEVYFSGYDPVHGYEILKTDGTAAGTTLAVEVRPGSKPQGASNRPTNLVVVGDKLFFVADDGVTGKELYVTDGTQAGTTLLELTPGPASTFVYDGIAFGEQLAFVATEPNFGREVWLSDGSVAGTNVLVDLVPGPALGASAILGVASGSVIFAGADGVQPGDSGVWSSDGSPGALQPLLLGQWRVDSSTADSAPIGSDERLIFVAQDDIDDTAQMWITDGASAAPLHETVLFSGYARSLDSVFFVQLDDGPFDIGAELYRFPFADTGDYALDPLGSGCASTSGSTPSIAASGAAKSTQPIQVALAGTAPGSPAWLLAGSAGAPLQLTADCVLQPGGALQLASSAITDGAGQASVPLVMPASPAWHGLPVALQWFVFEPGGAIANLGVVSDGLEVLIGP